MGVHHHQEGNTGVVKERDLKVTVTVVDDMAQVTCSLCPYQEELSPQNRAEALIRASEHLKKHE